MRVAGDSAEGRERVVFGRQWLRVRAWMRMRGAAGGGFRIRTAILATVIIAVLAAGVAVAAGKTRSGAAQRPVAAGRRQDVPTSSPSPSAAPPLRVMAVSPGRHARRVKGTRPVRVSFSAPVAADSPLPQITPAVRGSWQRSGDQLVFTPAVPFTPGTLVTLRIPAGLSGMRSSAGGLLAKQVVVRFRTRGWSTLRLEQLLAQLGYLPLSWTPRHSPASASTGRAAQLAAVYSPPKGRFTWNAAYPAELTSQWQPGTQGIILTGALMAFQSVHGMPMTGTADPALWKVLLRAVARGDHNPNGYSYALASKTLPETLTVWHNGTVVMHGVANTGIPASPTADGTFPVYLRYRNQVMKGVNPDGSHYSDPVQYVSYFNGGDAVHSYFRTSYGFPQSLGCVELPLNEAAQVWPYLTYGTLVSVVG